MESNNNNNIDRNEWEKKEAAHPWENLKEIMNII